jgi:hypothetical protein
LLIFLCPIIVFFYQKKKSKILKFQNIILLLLTISFSALLTLYSATQSGEFQVESIASGFLTIYILIISFNKNLKINNWKFWLATLSILLSVGLKEPFLIIVFGISLIFSNSFKEIFNKFILPALSAGIIGIFILFINGHLFYYLKYYLFHMSSLHINRYGSPIWRAFNIGLLFRNLNNFSYFFGFLVILLFISYSFVLKKNKFIKIISFLSILFLTSFTVGMGGEYYPHHFIFATPIYLSLFIYFLKTKKLNKYFLSTTVCLIIFIILTIFNLKKPNYSKILNDFKKRDKIVQNEALYVDQVLDELNENRYFFLGRNRFQLYGFTKHSPQGQFFFQFNNWTKLNFQDNNKKLIKNLYDARIIVFDDFELDHLTSYFGQYIEKNFTTKTPIQLKNLKRSENKYLVYFRKNLYQ